MPITTSDLKRQLMPISWIICGKDGPLGVLAPSLDGFRETIHRFGRWFCQYLVDLERKVFDAVVQFLFEDNPTVICPFIDRSQWCFAPKYA